jgi:hypothetical protein
VPTYYDLGPTKLLTGVTDPGNKFVSNCWTVSATSDVLNTKLAQAEAYQISIATAPVGSSFQLYRNSQLWNTVLQGWANNYDPVNPLYVRDGDSLFFYWNSSALPVPSVVIWLRYDVDNPANNQQLS